MTGRLVQVLMLCALAAGSPRALGQEKPVPPPRMPGLPADSTAPAPDREAPLPAIDLPEFQITGREEIQLEEFPRTAAESGRGLGPPDTGPRTGERATGPEPLGDDPRDAALFRMPVRPFSGRAIAGYGSYRTPYFDASVGTSSPSAGVLLKAGFLSSEGFAPATAHRRGYGEISADWTAQEGDVLPAGSRIEGAFGLRGATYRLTGTPTPDQTRSLSRISLGGTLASAAGTEFRYGGALRVASLRSADSLRVRDSRVVAGTHAEYEAGAYLLRADAGLAFGFIDAPGRERQPYTHRAGFTVRTALLPQVDLAAGASAVFYRNMNGGGRVRLKPSAEVLWYAAPDVTLFARFHPQVESHTLESLLEVNPYAASPPSLFHRDELLAVSAGVAWEPAKGISARAIVRHALARGDLLWIPAGGVWALAEEGISRRTGLDLDVTVRPNDGNLVVVSLGLEGTRSSLTGNALPYAPVLRGAARYEHRFPFGLEAGAALTAVGERTVTPAADRTIGGFALLDLFAQMPLVARLYARADIANVPNAAYRWWDGIRPVPRSVTLSLGVTW